VAGNHNFRDKAVDRYRHRYFRKGKYIYDKIGELGCVGCGRCVRSCTASIANPLAVFNELALARGQGGRSALGAVGIILTVAAPGAPKHGYPKIIIKLVSIIMHDAVWTAGATRGGHSTTFIQSHRPSLSIMGTRPL
jgi:ferredoxin